MFRRIIDSLRKKDKTKDTHTDLETATTNGWGALIGLSHSSTIPASSAPSTSYNSEEHFGMAIDEYFFHCAGLLGKHEYVQEVLDKKKTANVKDHANRNILHHACQWGNIETVKYAISRGVPVNVKDSLGNTPLHYCCGEGYFNIVALLLYHPKIKIDVKNKEGKTPRRKAYFHGHDDVLMLLDKFMGNIALFKEKLKNQVIDVKETYPDYKLGDIFIRTLH